MTQTKDNFFNRSHYKNYRSNQGAKAARVDHAWLHNVVDCAFNRCYKSNARVKNEAFQNALLLHRYGIERYGYIVSGTLLPMYR